MLVVNRLVQLLISNVKWINSLGKSAEHSAHLFLLLLSFSKSFSSFSTRFCVLFDDRNDILNWSHCVIPLWFGLLMEFKFHFSFLVFSYCLLSVKRLGCGTRFWCFETRYVPGWCEQVKWWCCKALSGAKFAQIG